MVPQLPKIAVGALSYLSGLTNFDSRLGQLFENGLKKTGAEKTKRKKLRDDARASLSGWSMFNNC